MVTIIGVGGCVHAELCPHLGQWHLGDGQMIDDREIRGAARSAGELRGQQRGGR